MLLSESCAMLLAVCCLSGCAYSIRPVATKDVLVDEPDLSGTWQTDHREKQMRVGRVPLVMKKVGKEYPGLYRMEFVHEKGAPSCVWHAQLLKLGDVLYVELSPINSALNPMQAEYNLALHKLFRIAATKDELRVDVCNDPKLLAAATKGRLGVLNDVQGRSVITASSRELQQLYRERGSELFDVKRAIRFRKQH